jgi:hypothetical protein
MSVKFTHYLITRFNVPVKNWDRDKAGQPVLDDAWMHSRLDLFRRYCVPGVANQTNRNFTWLIYCDKLTSQTYLNEIYKAISGVPNVMVRQVSHFEELMTDLRQLFSTVPTPYVISSRVDNDDSLGPTYIHEVQKHFVEHDKRIINFLQGVLYDTHRGVLTEIRKSHLNHYGSLIEELKPDTGTITIMGYPHGRPPEGSTVTDIDLRFAWLKIIHERNMASKTNGIPLFDNNVTAHFGLPPDDLPRSYWATSIFVLRRLLSRLKRKLFSH